MQLLLAAKIPAPCNVLPRSKINTGKWTQQNQINCASDLDLLCKLFLLSSAVFNHLRYQMTAT